ncbi:MAG TPA: hypothetical protein VG944_15020 [Fimbriimonas sp.]|nr:hypothetical protein [Fimbriimonas sp.]
MQPTFGAASPIREEGNQKEVASEPTMTTDQKLLMRVHGSTTLLETVQVLSLMAFSSRARKRYRALAAVSSLFRKSLVGSAGSEKRSVEGGGAGWLLLLLTCICLIEWCAYTLPAARGLFTALSHQCGLR